MNTLSDILELLRAAPRDDLLLVRREGAAAFDSVGTLEFLEQIDTCAAALGGLGVGRGDRVGLISRNRPEWHVVDFACHRLGAIVVPLFSTLTSHQVRHCFGDSGCCLVVVDDAEQLDKVCAVAAELGLLRNILVLDPPPAMPACSTSEIADFDAVMAAAREAARDEENGPDGGGDIGLSGPEGPDSVATLIYTSGTTGPPKGVMLTHRNLLANVEGVLERSPIRAGEVGLSLLPLCHVYERTIDYCYFVGAARIAYSRPREVSADFKLVRPHIMVGVPRLYEKVRDAVEERVESSRAIDRGVYRHALAAGMKRARAELAGEREGLLNKLLFPLFAFLVLEKIRAVTGGRMRVMSAGGAALPPALNWWYAAIGWDMVQGYGLTESSPIISTNAPGDNRIGTVGRVLCNVEVKIAEDGEILTRGPHVMKGYWNQPETTAEAVVDGWLHTGDIGTLDADGYLSVTERKKAILVTSTGKNVAPAPVEGAILASPWIEQVMLIGDDRRFVSALIVPALGRLATWATERGLDSDPQSLCREPATIDLIGAELDRCQAAFSAYERARAFRLVPRPFSIEDGQLTPTMKLVRHKVLSDYAELVEEIYAD